MPDVVALAPLISYKGEADVVAFQPLISFTVEEDGVALELVTSRALWCLFI
jgi:hypothetical protein